jgi:DNA-binding transcriptional ArsR family regulator
MRMLYPSALPLVEHIVARLRAIADPVRVRILARLQQGAAPVGQLAAELEVGQASMSKHLAILRQAGIIAAERDGNHTICRIRDPSIKQLCTLVCDGVQRHVREEHERMASAATSASVITKRRPRKRTHP